MSNYVLLTDSACDISQKDLREWGVRAEPLSVLFEGSDIVYSNYDIRPSDFYARMRDGAIAKTSAVNVDAYIKFFEPELEQGNDILYLGFSGGLSTSTHGSTIAAADLMEKYPDRRIEIVDTLCASGGQGLIVWHVLQKKNAGATLDEATAYAKEILPHMCHWFTVDDLVYLKRGGRVSPAVAFVGGMLNIKPVLHVDDEGHLIKMSTARGRKKSIAAIADKYGETAVDKENGTVFISHGDCMEDAQTLAEMLKERYGTTVKMITDIGPVIGAHSGPGTLALFYYGTER